MFSRRKTSGSLKLRIRSLLAVLTAMSFLHEFPPAARAEDQIQPAEGANEPAESLSGFALPAAGTIPAGNETRTLQQPQQMHSPASANAASTVDPAPVNAAGNAPPLLRDNSPSLTKAADGETDASNHKDRRNQLSKSSTVSTTIIPSSLPAGGQVSPVELNLPNGLKVLIVENHEFPVVSTLVWYRVGSRDEQVGSTGLSHMVEHLMFGEVGPFKSGDIGNIIARVGGQFNGYTSDDFTTFFETMPSSKLEMALKIEAERMTHARFTESDVKQEIANIQKEIETESKDPSALLSREVRAMMFMQHPYHNPTTGWKTDVESLTPEIARNFYEKFFTPANATLIVAGDVDPKSVTALVDKYFLPLSGAKTPAHVNVNEPLPRTERRVNIKYSGNKELMQVAYRAPAMDDGDAPAMVVLERILNGGLSGRLKSRLVESKICSSAQANYEIKKDAGLFTITCTAVPATPNAQTKILEILDGTISQLRDKLLSDADLRRARNQAEFAYFSECDGPYREGFHLGYFESLDRWQNAYAWAEKIRAVSAADLNRAAKKYLAGDARVVGWIAGNAAPKPAVPRSTAPDSPVRDHEKNSPGKQVEHVRLTGYKEDDGDIAPNQASRPRDSKTGGKTSLSGMPAVMRDIPSALGNAVMGNIPGAVGNVGSVILNLPGAIGDIGTAVGTTATAIGKQVVQMKAGQESHATHLSHRVLKNGLNVIVFQSRISPVVQICGSIHAGEAYSPRAKAGSSLVASALLSQGSEKRGRAQMAAAQDDAGIAPGHMLKFESGLETIDFSTRCLSRDLPAQVELLAENLSKPSFDELLFEKAKQDALSVLKRGDDSIGQKVDRVLLQGLLDENSPFCPSDPAAKARSIGLLTLPESQKFFATHIVPGATTVVVAGDCQPDEVFALMEKSFAGWSGKTAHSELHAKIRSQRILRSSIPVKESKKTSICFGQIVPVSQAHSDYGSLLIADGILVNHPMFSRFEQALSKNPALETAISNGEMSVKLQPLANLTWWSLSLSLEPSAVPASVKLIKSELQNIVRSGVTQQEFAEVKRYLLGVLTIRTQSTLSAVSNSLLDSAEHTDTVNAYNAALASVRSATVESVNKVIRGVFKPEQSSIVIAGAPQSIKSARTKAASDSAGGN